MALRQAVGEAEGHTSAVRLCEALALRVPGKKEVGVESAEGVKAGLGVLRGVRVWEGPARPGGGGRRGRGRGGEAEEEAAAEAVTGVLCVPEALRVAMPGREGVALADWLAQEETEGEGERVAVMLLSAVVLAVEVGEGVMSGLPLTLSEPLAEPLKEAEGQREVEMEGERECEPVTVTLPLSPRLRDTVGLLGAVGVPRMDPVAPPSPPPIHPVALMLAVVEGEREALREELVEPDTEMLRAALELAPREAVGATPVGLRVAVPQWVEESDGV